MKKIIFVVGMPRCGTTSFCSVMGQHPQVFSGVIKEPGYFLSSQKDRLHSFTSAGDNVSFSDSGYITTSSNYMTNFADFDNTEICLDGSTIYSLHCDDFIESVKKSPMLRGVEKKFIVGGRDPFERALSHYDFSVSRGEEFRSFERALLEEVEGQHSDWLLGGYIKGGQNQVVADKLIAVFGEDAVLQYNISSDEIFTQDFFNDVTDFLAAQQFHFDFDVYRNSNIKNSSITFRKIRVLLKNIRKLNPTFFESLIFRKLFNAFMKLGQGTSDTDNSEHRDVYDKYALLANRD